MVVDSRNVWNNVGVCIAAQKDSSFLVLQADFYELFRCVIADGGSVCYTITNSRQISNYSTIPPLENHRGLMNMFAKKTKLTRAPQSFACWKRRLKKKKKKKKCMIT